MTPQPPEPQHESPPEQRQPLEHTGIHGFPREVTSFVGRHHELAQLISMANRSALTTLTGTGGVGKTRLAIRLAAALSPDHPDGTWFIRLTDISEDTLVEQFVERALSFERPSGDRAAQSIIDRLVDKRVLIVLDNCEHVLDGAARLAHDLIHGAAGVRVIATSRESLKVHGENIFEVPPLSAGPTAGGPYRGGRDAPVPDALQLFIDRAASASPGFEVDAEGLDTIARLCERLDGLPLAIELAAVRVRALSPYDLLDRQEAFFDLLAGGNTGADQRHRTLHNAIKWSFDLCSHAEQELWTRLSVFAGGFEVDAAESVCADSTIKRSDIPLLLADLVDKSVLSTAHPAGRVRYRMLESIRAFGLEKLAEFLGSDIYRKRHLGFYLELAESSERQNLGAVETDINDRLQRERANLEAAVTVCLSRPDLARSGMQLVGSLWFYWNANGHLRAGQFWLSKVLEADVTPSPERAKCLWVLGWFNMIQGDNAEARRRLDEAITTADLVADRESRALAMQFLGTVEHIDGNTERAVELLDFSIGEHDAQQGSGSLPLLGIVQKAFVYCLTDSADQAVTLSDAAISTALRSGEQFSASWAMWTKGMAHWALGQYPEAKDSLRQALQIKRELHDWLGVSVCLDVLAWVAVNENEMAQAATLWGEGFRLYGEVGSLPLFGSAKHVEIREAHQARAKEALGPATFAEYFDMASRPPVPNDADHASVDACDVPDGSVDQTPSVSLTRREREIGELVAQELSNREIAELLVVSVRTVEGHVQNLLNKFGVHSRQELSRRVKAGPTLRPATTRENPG